MNLDGLVVDRVRSMSQRDRDVIAENVHDLREDPHRGHPSGLSTAKRLAWQHNCPHSFTLLYRWKGGDQSHPSRLVTIERIIDRYC